MPSRTRGATTVTAATGRAQRRDPPGGHRPAADDEHAAARQVEQQRVAGRGFGIGHPAIVPCARMVDMARTSTHLVSRRHVDLLRVVAASC